MPQKRLGFYKFAKFSCCEIKVFYSKPGEGLSKAENVIIYIHCFLEGKGTYRFTCTNLNAFCMSNSNAKI